MWNRTRIYDDLSAGPHTISVECRTDSGTISLGNNRMPLNLGVVTYPTIATNPKVHTAHVDQVLQHSVAVGSQWVDLSGFETTITTNGGPLEIGASVSFSGGSTSTCRPTINGSHVFAGEGDDYNIIWSEGLARSEDGWVLWDRVRIYENVPAGTHTIGLQCRTDSGTLLVGRVDSGSATSTLWGVAYDL
jgi:hypothetical protein